MNIFSIPQQKESPVYKKSPLMQTIFRVDYLEKPLKDKAQLDLFAHMISEEFPEYRPQYPDVVLQNPINNPPDEDELVLHHFYSGGQIDQIDIMSPYFSFMTLRYGSWETFKTKAIRYFDIFTQVCKHIPSRISLEFVNFLPEFLLLREGKPLKSYVNSSLCGPMADYPFLVAPVTEYSGNLEWMIGDNDYLHLSYGTGFVPDIQKKMFYFDITVFGFEDQQMAVADRLEIYHAKAYDAFRWSITEELDEYFSGSR